MKKLILLLMAGIVLCSWCALAEEIPGKASLVEAVNYCEVIEPGEVITAIRLEYSEPVAMNAIYRPEVYFSQLSTPYATTKGREICAVYTNTTGVKGDVEGCGQYVFIELDTSFMNIRNYRDYITFNQTDKVRNYLPTVVVQNRDIFTVNGNVIPMGTYTTSRDVRRIIDDFQIINWTYEATGTEYELLLYVPAGYDGSTAFPLVAHFTNGGDASYTDYSGHFLGGLFAHSDVVTWADPESQAKNPGFVLSYGKAQTAEMDADVQMAMINYVLDNYNIDRNRVYAVALAGATPRLFECALAYPDTFAAIVYCSYDPIHVYRALDPAIENYVRITSLFPTWAIVSEADHTAAVYETVPAEMQGVGKGARFGNFAKLLNEQYGANITIAGNEGDMPMWNGYLRGAEATKLAEELVQLGEAKGSDDFLSIFIAGTTPALDHWSWANGFINMGVHDWLFQQSK